MLHTPIINPYYTIRTLHDEGCIFLSEFGHVTFYEPIFLAIISLIDGKITVNDILDQLINRFNASHIYYALFALEQKKYILEKNTVNENSEDIYWLSQHIDPKVAKSSIHQQKISIKQYGKFDIDPLKAALVKSGMQIAKSGVIDIIVTDSYLRSDLKTYNQHALTKQHPWLLIKPNGLEPWIGPLFIPGRTGCYQCLRYYLKRNHRIESYVASKNRDDNFPVTSLANYMPHFKIVYNITISLLSKYLIHSDENLLINNLLSLNTNTFQVTQHKFIKREHCTLCGQSKKINPLTSFQNLQSSKAISINDGGYRIVTSEETVKRYQHLVSPITGIVPTLQAFHDDGMFVYFAHQNHAFPINHLNALKQSLKNNCAGKGISKTQAKASALCEVLERYSGEFQGNETRLTASYHELGESAIHPNTCMLFSEKQYQERVRFNESDSKFTCVCEPFDTNLKIEWSPVWSLSKKTLKYLPTQYLYFYYQDQQNKAMYCYPDSNGNAAGNTLEEAILQGFFELVERDAIAIWWYNRLQRPIVLLESFNNSYFLKLQNHYKLKQRDLWVIDITHDLGIPTFVAISKKINTAQESIILGFGCHVDANLAISRALTEMNQMFVAVNQIENEQSKIDSTLSAWLDHTTVSEQIYLLPDANLPAKKMTDYELLTERDLLFYLHQCQTIIEKKNMELLVLNQTRPEIGLYVVKVLYPGLRHMWARFAKGRLYDVPVQMEWLKKPLKENELNPIPIFL